MVAVRSLGSTYRGKQLVEEVSKPRQVDFDLNFWPFTRCVPVKTTADADCKFVQKDWASWREGTQLVPYFNVYDKVETRFNSYANNRTDTMSLWEPDITVTKAGAMPEVERRCEVKPAGKRGDDAEPAWKRGDGAIHAWDNIRHAGGKADGDELTFADCFPDETRYATGLLCTLLFFPCVLLWVPLLLMTSHATHGHGGVGSAIFIGALWLCGWVYIWAARSNSNRVGEDSSERLVHTPADLFMRVPLWGCPLVEANTGLVR